MRHQVFVLLVLLVPGGACKPAEEDPATIDASVSVDGSVGDGGIDGTIAIDAPPAATIGSGGGTLVSADGILTLMIPPNALTTDTPIAITLVPQATWGSGIAAYAPVSPVYAIEPEGTVFAIPVTATWRFAVEPVVLRDVNGALSLVQGESRAADGMIEVHPVARSLPGADGPGSLRVETQLMHLSEQWLATDATLFGNPGPRVTVGKATAKLRGGRHGVENPWRAELISYETIDTFTGNIRSYGESSGNVAVVSDPNDFNPGLTAGQTWVADPRPEFKCTTAGAGTAGVEIKIEEDFGFGRILTPSATFKEDVTCVEEKTECKAEVTALGTRITTIPTPGTSTLNQSQHQGKYGYWVVIEPLETIKVCVSVSGGSGSQVYYPRYPPGFQFVDTTPGCTEIKNIDTELQNMIFVVVDSTATVTVTTTHISP